MKEKEEKLPLLYATDSRRSTDHYSREEIVTRSPMGETFAIYGDKKHWAAFRDVYKLICLGPKTFWKRTNTTNATFKNNKLYGDFKSFIPNIIEIFNYNWIRDNKWTMNILQERKDLWKMVFSGKISNPESLCKVFSRKYFKGAYSYAALKKCAKDVPGAPLWDLYYYTTNPEEALRKYCGSSTFSYSLFSDCLQYAKILNTQINPLWSEKRLREVHQKQIELRERSKLDAIPNIEIFSKYEANGLSLINNERECYLEGCNMHNCVHSCYWRQITHGNYLIARGVVDDKYVDVGIRVSYNTPPEIVTLDQVHTIYNGMATKSILDFCSDWIKRHTLELLSRAQQAKDFYHKVNAHRVETEVAGPLPF